MFWGTPSFFWDKKSTMILFENFKKVPAPPDVNVLKFYLAMSTF